jgi:penicillin-binding protein 1A
MAYRFKIEHVYNKQQILTLYFNTVPFGNNSFGIKTASLKYFNKTPGPGYPGRSSFAYWHAQSYLELQSY